MTPELDDDGERIRNCSLCEGQYIHSDCDDFGSPRDRQPTLAPYAVAAAPGGVAFSECYGCAGPNDCASKGRCWIREQREREASDGVAGTTCRDGAAATPQDVMERLLKNSKSLDAPLPRDRSQLYDSGAVAMSSETQTPSAEPVAWQDVHCPHDLYLRKPYQIDCRPLYTHPSPDIRDAERYRWLHQFDQWSWSQPPMRAVSFSWSIKCDKATLDAIIDRAIDTAIAKENL